jgi:hypothetical protein
MFTPEQQTTLRSLMDRIIPPDEDPGAWEAGVGDYLARQFASDLRDYLPFYRIGLDALEAEALSSAQTNFAMLPIAEQDALLSRLETRQVSHQWPIDPAKFFQTVIEHVIEGYYSDPGNGGNRGAASWRMIGYVPGVRGRGE